jgi:hypothetical protein
MGEIRLRKVTYDPVLPHPVRGIDYCAEVRDEEDVMGEGEDQ